MVGITLGTGNPGSTGHLRELYKPFEFSPSSFESENFWPAGGERKLFNPFGKDFPTGSGGFLHGVSHIKILGESGGPPIFPIKFPRKILMCPHIL